MPSYRGFAVRAECKGGKKKVVIYNWVATIELAKVSETEAIDSGRFGRVWIEESELMLRPAGYSAPAPAPGLPLGPVQKRCPKTKPKARQKAGYSRDQR